MSISEIEILIRKTQCLFITITYIAALRKIFSSYNYYDRVKFPRAGAPAIDKEIFFEKPLIYRNTNITSPGNYAGPRNIFFVKPLGVNQAPGLFSENFQTWNKWAIFCLTAERYEKNKATEYNRIDRPLAPLNLPWRNELI